MKLSCIAALTLVASAAPPTPDPSVLDLGTGVVLRLSRIPAGEFVMGESHLNRSDIGYFSPHELIHRRVRLTKPFSAGTYLVTRQQFRRFVEASGHVTDAESGSRPWRGLTRGAYTVSGDSWGPRPDASWRSPGFPQGDTHPVTCISWYDAEAFCRWASAQTGRKVRLPTEAELEYLQRTGTETRYYWGSHTDSRSRWANVADDGMIGDEDLFPDGQPTMKHTISKGRNDGYRYTTPVGFFDPNPFGLYDAIGNVWQYTQDWEGPDPARVDPQPAAGARFKSMKGGSWMSTPDFYRPSIRIQVEPESRTSTRGMRVVVEE